MYELLLTDGFTAWLKALKDHVGAAAIAMRLNRLAKGNAGDVAPIGKGLSELRIDHGPGYRVYFMRHGQRVYVVLGGGIKRTQAADIEAAQRLAADIRQSLGDEGKSSGKDKT
ncbi:MAG: type II toxin-antitoxin system RelE/ParE family toxin [Alphaproteobacteria bacterium]|jgi:putative addiction module killer protein|nr:type II toxin-antitoxin system RelE/ParE family toxin [Alphaproteobacteria bacterium]